MFLATQPAAAKPTGDSQIATLDQRVARNPIDADLRRARAAALHKAGRLDDALDDLNVAQRITEEPPESTALRARILADVGRSDQALETLDALLASHPNSPSALELRGRLRLRRNDPLGAMADLESACQAPTLKRVLIAAQTAVALEQLDRASELLRRGQQVLGNHPLLVVEGARVQLAMGHPAGAFATLEALLYDRPHEARWRLLRADAQAAMGHENAAQAEREAVLALLNEQMTYPPSQDIALARAHALQDLGRTAQAQEALLGLLKRNPSLDEARLMLNGARDPSDWRDPSSAPEVPPK
jgi:tetratricopeptide (TPR) repeat protein